MVIFKVVQSDGGLVRLELGRSRFRYPTRPSYIPTIAFSLHYMIIPEMPLYFNLSTAMGLTRFDSDDDDEGDLKNLYVFDWRPKVRARARAPPWGVNVVLLDAASHPSPLLLSYYFSLQRYRRMASACTSLTGKRAKLACLTSTFLSSPSICATRSKRRVRFPAQIRGVVHACQYA